LIFGLLNMKNKLFLIWFFFSINAYSNSNWVYVIKDVPGNINFIDNKSIQKSGDSITFWVRTNFIERDKFGDLSTKIQNTINCRTREIIGRHYMFYDDLNNTGKLTLNTGSTNEKWTPIAPDTVNWGMYTHVCK
jgi:hypothetical protein